MDALLFIGALIAGATEALKQWIPLISGKLTIIVAVVIGIGVALLDTHIGLVDITIAEGIVSALATVGVVTTVSKIG